MNFSTATSGAILTTGAASRMAGVMPDTIRTWERRGWIPCQRTAGGVRLFAESDVRRVAAERAARRETKGGHA